MKLKSLLLYILLQGAALQLPAQNVYHINKPLLKIIEQNLRDADAQYRVMMKMLPQGELPRSYDEEHHKLVTSNADWWCSGFYTGTLFNLYKSTHDDVLLREALSRLPLSEKEQYNTSTHDLGFMMFCSYGNANGIKSSPAYRQILINSAKSLSTRFNPKVGCIRSWESKDPSDFIVIIDNMMNLELLFWASKVTGDPSYAKIAVTHANTTMENHYRPDYSAYHVVNYNAETGRVKERKTAQGAANESAWARGQAWGLYGYTLMYRETHNPKYLEQAKHIAHFLLTNPNLPADKIPYWDFNAPGIPDALRDASAAAIMSSALLELCRYVKGDTGKTYFHTAETILRNLSSPTYKSKPRTNGGFILQHSVGHKPANSEVDVPLTYADYYFVEAMRRYKEF